MDNILNTLNERQHEAVTTTEGFFRIVAGAGSGKTKALTHRYAYLVKAAGIQPRNILCVTFTSKAAGEMRSRIRHLIGDGYDTSLVTTYHGFCVRVLRADIEKLFYPKNFLILDIADQKKILEEIYTELELKMDHSSFQKILSQVGKRKSDTLYVKSLVDPDKIINTDDTDLDDKIFYMYLQRQKKVFGLDFNDLINFTFYLFDKHEETMRKWQEQLHYIQVDEFQDSSDRELRLLDILSDVNENLFVVGDPDQNIYEWRGSRMEILVNFDKTHNGTKTIIMDQNYRSTPQILAVANSLIDKNTARIKKNLFTHNPNGAPVVHLHAKDERSEATWIVSEIKSAVKRGERNYYDYAMLYRAGFLSRYLEQALLDEDIPYRMWGSSRFYDRMEIRDTIAYLRMVVYQDNYSFLRVINVPRRKMGKNRVTYIKACAEEEGISYYKALVNHVCDRALNGTGAYEFVWLIELFQKKVESSLPSEILNELLDKSGYRRYIRENGDMERLDNLAELCKAVTEYERNYGEELSLEEYLNHVALRYDEEERGDNNDFVRLMTIHASKGLEFPCVFVAGMSDGVFPSSRSIEERKQAGLEEERRLCFVAITRAREQLYLTESEGFGAGGQRKCPSRFLFNVDEGLYERIGTVPKELEADSRKNICFSETQTIITRRALGDKVSHMVFGDGEIQSIDNETETYNIFFSGINKIKPISIDYDFSNTIYLEKGVQTNVIGIPSTTGTDAELTEVHDAINSEEWEKADTYAYNCFQDYSEEQNRDNTKDYYEESTEEHSEEYTETHTTEYSSDEHTNAHTSPFISDEQESAENCNKKHYELTYDPGEKNLWKRADVPHEGWRFVNLIDLGSPAGVCGMCGHQVIRYVHIMTHPNYSGSIGAGSVCAGRMEGNLSKADKREREYRNMQNRRSNFLKRKWKTSRKGNLFLTLEGVVIIILPDKFLDGYWRYSIHNKMSESFPSLEQAKLAAFDMVIYGKD